MKRSEMVLVIANAIYNNSMRSSLMETLPLAEKVLQAIESAGMQPPTLTVFEEVRGTIMGDGFKVGKKVNRWQEDQEFIDKTKKEVESAVKAIGDSLEKSLEEAYKSSKG